MRIRKPFRNREKSTLVTEIQKRRRRNTLCRLLRFELLETRRLLAIDSLLSEL
jgi:hypothetical protein